MRTLRNIVLTLPLMLITGCSWIYGDNGLVQNNEYSYLESEMSPELQVPEGMSAVQIVDEYPIPEISDEAKHYPVGKELLPFAPTIILAVDTRSGVYSRDEKFAPTVWFRIREIRIWQALLDFLSANNVPILNKNAEEGIIETNWVEIDQSSYLADWFGSDEARALRFKYRFTLSKSPKGNLQLLSVQNTASQRSGYENDNWQDDDTSRKQAILFMNDFLGTWSEQREFEARKRVLAANKGISLEMGFDNNENSAFIASADFQQTWEKLGSALPEIGFKIKDKDQSLGIYYIEYEGEESKGFVDSLKFWNSSEKIDLPLEEEDYQLNLSTMGNKTAITISIKEGSVLSLEKMNKLLPYFSNHFGLEAQSMKREKKRRKDGMGKGKKGKHK